jgi:hypothetical protein
MRPRKQSDLQQQRVVEFPGIVGTDSTSNENPATQQVMASGGLSGLRQLRRERGLAEDKA